MTFQSIFCLIKETNFVKTAIFFSVMSLSQKHGMMNIPLLLQRRKHYHCASRRILEFVKIVMKQKYGLTFT